MLLDREVYIAPTTQTIENVFTIGGYGFTEDVFFRTLVDAGIDVFCDVRQRRGMRGSTFAFLNSTRLQARLAEVGIAYLHMKEFAPTNSIRQKQKDADAKLGIQKRSREVLGDEFAERYSSEILRVHRPEDFFSRLPRDAKRPCLFCVERRAGACHRSLMSNWLVSGRNVQVVHL
jgi:uncharacterized protein (DUF488 family)